MPSTPSAPSLILAIVLTVSAAVVGLAAFWPAESAETGPPIGHNASERLSSLDGYTAVVESEYTFGNESNRSVQRVWARPSTGERRVEPIEGPTDSVVVANGSVTWVYDREANEATRLNTTAQPSGTLQQGERIERLFTRLNISRDATEETKTVDVEPGGAPLPSVPSGQPAPTPRGPDVEAADEFGVRYEGTDTVADREVYVVSIEPETTDDNAAVFEEYEQTLYGDTEWFLPLKTHTEWEMDGRHVETTTTYRNVTFEPGVDDDRFRFDPPENVTITDTGFPSPERYDSAAELRANTEFPVPEPDVPDAYTFEEGVVTAGADHDSITLRYAAGDESLHVVRRSASGYDLAESDTSRAGDVGNDTAYYTEYEFDGDTTAVVVLPCGDVTYSVSGPLSKGESLGIAESLGCE